MIDERTTEIVIERLIDRIEQANTYFLMKMGDSIKKIRNLTPTQAQQLIQILKYGDNYNDIVKKIANYIKLDINEIDKIFYEYAKKDQLFYEKFYKYRNIPFTPIGENSALKMQITALSNIAKQQMYKFTRSNVLGYSIKDLKGRAKFIGLRETYNRVLDEAFLNVSQGKDTFDSAMTKIMKEIGGSGLKTVDYKSGRSIRLDSSVRMHLKESLRGLHNEMQQVYGDEFGADGVEISVHENPATDHEEVQGKQFSNAEFRRLQQLGYATTYDGEEIDLHLKLKNGARSVDFRPISEYNCYHYIFSIVLGVSEPEYSKKQLNEIIKKNDNGFELDGKHYTNYEGTQLQRNLERAIREQKDIQIFAKSGNNLELVDEAQQKITLLTRKYKELSDVSGLPTKMQRLKVSGYKRVAKDKLK